MAETESEIEHLEESDDIYERFVATLTEHDISNLCAGALTLQLFGGVEKERNGGRQIRGNIHTGIIVGAETNVPGLVSHLLDLVPNSERVNASNSTYTGITGPVRSLGPDKGWYLDRGALTAEQTEYLAVGNPGELDDKSNNCLKEAVGSGGVTVSKKGYHETVPVDASILLIGYPIYGDWDEYETYWKQVQTIDSSLASRLDLVYPDVDGRKERSNVPPLESKAASEYIRHARDSCSPAIPVSVDDALFESLVEIHVDALDKSSVPQQAEDTIRRLTEASAKTRLAEEASMKDATRAITLYRRPFEVLHNIDYEPPDIDYEEAFKFSNESSRKKQIVQQIIAEGGVTVEETAIVQKALDKGLEEREVHQILGELKGRGEISKNTQGCWHSYSS